MTFQLEIPDLIVEAFDLPQQEVERRIRLELALALYAQEVLAIGKAVEFAGISRYEFADALGKRNIARHYSEDDLASDLE